MTDTGDGALIAPRSTQTAGIGIPGHALTPRGTRSFNGRRQWLVTCTCGWAGPAAKTQERALRAAEAHMTKAAAEAVKVAAKRSCPTPRKKRFRTREKAEADIHHFWRNSKPGERMTCRPYLCRCGYWHTTKRPAKHNDRSTE